MANKNEDKDALYSIIGFIIFLIIAFSIVPKVFNFVTGGSSDAKDYCADSWKVKSAKTDYAAKKAYKACIKNY